MAFARILWTFTNKTRVLQHQLRNASCWSCGRHTQGVIVNVFCSNCNALQMPEKNENYFKILGIKESYDVDENDMARKFKELQKYLHPDKFANKAKKEQEISEKYSSLVNEAYKTLLEPLTRGLYMLQLKGEELSENTDVDQEFLIKIMEKNEEVESAETEEDIMALNQENKAILKDLQKKVSEAFYKGDLKRVTKLLRHMKYYTSIDNQIQGLIRSKGIIR